MTVFHIGRTTLISDLRRLEREHDYLEIDVPNSAWPKPKVFETLRSQAPEGFEFGIRLPRELTILSQEASRDFVEKARAGLGQLGAKWLVLSDAPTLRPTLRARERLAELFDELRAEAWRIAWQPQGLWEAAAASAFAKTHAVTQIVDPTDPKAVVEAVCYCRVSRLSLRAGLKPAQAERIAEKLAPTESAYLVLPRKGAERDTSARLMRSLLVPSAALAGALDRVADASSGDEEEAFTQDEEALEEDDL